MRLTVLCAVAFIASSLSVRAEEEAVVRAADGFQLPVGPNGTGQGYYIARGVRPNGHLGEDWNGLGGGDTDLGDPVYAIANGFVTFARNYHVGWGNVVILRHAYYEGSELKFCDSLYGHLLDFSVREGEQVHRGQQIGRIGNNFGMYEAHLHLEMRKNLQIGMFRSSFLRDFTNYYVPNEFIAEHRACPRPNSMVKIPINTYPAVAPPVVAGPHLESPIIALPHAGSPPTFARVNPLPPQGSSAISAATLTPKIVTVPSTPTPAVVTREAKIVNSQTPPPTPTVKISRSSAVSASAVAAAVANISGATPPASRKHKNSTPAASTPAPEASSPRVALKENSLENAPATPAPNAKHFKTGMSKATTASTIPSPEPPERPTKPSTTVAAVTSTATPTPAPSARHSKTVAAAATPAPKKGAKTPAPVAAAPTATPGTVAGNKKTHKSATPTPASDAPAGNEREVISSNPILPPPGPNTDVTPLTRTSSGFKVDRFEDLRGKGY